MPEQIILVDENDNQIGAGEKIDVHKKALLHRAFSIYVFDQDKKFLLQRRAKGKYHSEGLWTNTCCGHPRPNEKISIAAHRRLKEEFGFDCVLQEIKPFRYKVGLDKGLTENEFLHVFLGKVNEFNPKPNPEEIMDYKWVALDDVIKDVQKNPENYTEWFKMLLADANKLGEFRDFLGHK